MRIAVMNLCKKNLYSKVMIGWSLALLFSLITSINIIEAQQIDILLKGGHLIDPKNGINSYMDVAIGDGKILEVAENISTENAQQIIDVAGLYVTPGLIDFHVHFGNYHPRFPPDGFTFRAGVTTAVDGGTVGWRNYHLIEDVVQTSRTRILAFLAIVGSKGLLEGGHSATLLVQDMSEYDPVMAAGKINQHRDVLVGIKVWKSPDFEGIERAVEASRLADVPVMIDFGQHTPPLSLERLLLEVFRPGDIFTHAYAYHPHNREAIVDENYQVRSHVWEARERGIIFDVGHGGGAFSFEGAIPAVEQGFLPDVISTDLHRNSMNGGAKDMANVMSKFLNMGMSLEQVIEASTWKPAQVIKREELGNLSVGTEADVAVFNLREGDFGFLDVRNRLMKGTRKLEAELTIRAGQIVWDLNGLAGIPWDADLSVSN